MRSTSQKAPVCRSHRGQYPESGIQDSLAKRPEIEQVSLHDGAAE